jgi:hypothetical protein
MVGSQPSVRQSVPRAAPSITDVVIFLSSTSVSITSILFFTAIRIYTTLNSGATQYMWPFVDAT